MFLKELLSARVQVLLLERQQTKVTSIWTIEAIGALCSPHDPTFWFVAGLGPAARSINIYYQV
nr:hypothetical protein [Halomonas elongata]